MRAQVFLLALLAGSTISGQSAALDPSGTTVAVVPDAQAGGASGLRILKIEGPIFMGDVITTDIKGQVQIEFVDDTKFVVGANSKVTIDAFVFDANKTAQEVSISAVKGAFRFITGKSPKDNYTIRTPTMTIGVRGTAFDLAVHPGDGVSTVVVSEGTTDICDALRRCMEAHSGSMVVGSESGVRPVSDRVEQRQRLEAFFPMLQSQVGLIPGFIVPIPAALGLTVGETQDTANDNNTGVEPTREAPAPDGRPH